MNSYLTSLFISRCGNAHTRWLRTHNACAYVCARAYMYVYAFSDEDRVCAL